MQLCCRESASKLKACDNPQYEESLLDISARQDPKTSEELQSSINLFWLHISKDSICGAEYWSIEP